MVLVGQDRFSGHPHVLVGRILCIYLDIDREWHPALGVDRIVARLIDWLGDAAADRFESRTALFHPIGTGLPPCRSPAVWDHRFASGMGPGSGLSASAG